MLKKIDNNLFSAILYIVVGALLIIFKGQMIEWAMTIAGIFFLISGILEIVKKNYIGGGISLVIGAVIILLGWLITDIVLKVLGILVAVKGIIALIGIINAKNLKIFSIIFTALTVIAGIMLIFATGKIIDTVLIIAGIIFLVDGIIGIISALK